jgi:hypothetical protein
MPPADQAGERGWQELDVPRLPSEPERRLLAALADAVGAQLHDQLATVVVDAVCGCGCSSVRLRSTGQPIPADRVAHLSQTGRDDYVAVQATGRRPEQQFVTLPLHVMAGRVGESEVFDTIAGEGTAVRLADLEDLTEPTVG